MLDPKIFFDAVRGTKSAPGILGPTLEPNEVAGCNALLAACDGWPVSWAAYAFATAYHETGGTMQPIKEIGSYNYFMRRYDKSGQKPAVARDLGNTEIGDGAKYAGRGYVQLTGRRNYAKASAELGIDLVRNPDRAMETEIAAQILRHGMSDGWFTGKQLSDYLPARGQALQDQFVKARRIINGTDRALLIAGYAVQFQAALWAAGWRP
jgi:predicted chitinase